MEQSQAQAIADILLALPEKPTQRDYLVAFTKCYRAGFRQGVMAQGRQHEAVMSVIGRILEPRT